MTTTNKNTKLYRPLRYKELSQIIDSGMKRFPPRGFWQPIFYPVLNLRYANEIVDAWNVDDAYVVSFTIPEAYFKTFPVHTIGESYRQELWVPSWHLEEFNDRIVGEIQPLLIPAESPTPKTRARSEQRL